MPRLFPAVTDATSIFNLFTVVPVFVTAYICHYNGTHCQTYFSLDFFWRFYTNLTCKRYWKSEWGDPNFLFYSNGHILCSLITSSIYLDKQLT
jgi:hypothetical protein